MISTIVGIIGALIGMLGMWLKYKLDPKQAVYDKLDKLSVQKTILERQRDEAMAHNDNDALTVAGNALFKLHQEQDSLLQRLRNINSGK